MRLEFRSVGVRAASVRCVSLSLIMVLEMRKLIRFTGFIFKPASSPILPSPNHPSIRPARTRSLRSFASSALTSLRKISRSIGTLSPNPGHLHTSLRAHRSSHVRTQRAIPSIILILLSRQLQLHLGSRSSLLFEEVQITGWARQRSSILERTATRMEGGCRRSDARGENEERRKNASAKAF